MKWFTGLVSACAAAAVLVTGCGGGDEGSEAQPVVERQETTTTAEKANPAKEYCEALVQMVTDYDAQIIDMGDVYEQLYEIRGEHPDMTDEQERWTNMALRENKEQSGFQAGLLNLAHSCKNEYDTPLGAFSPVGGWDGWSPS